MEKLIQIDGDKVRDFILKEGITTIGRDSSNSIVLDDKSISRCHSKISNTKGKVTIIDLDSSNGIFINGEKVSGKVLENNDEILIGNSRFIFFKKKPLNKDQDNNRNPSLSLRDKELRAEVLKKMEDEKNSLMTPSLNNLNVKHLTIISQTPLFDLLTGEELKCIAGFINKKTFFGGDLIYAEGSVGDSLYIIVSGRVELTKRTSKGKKTRIAILERGNVFGEMSLLDDNPRSATAAALSKVELLYISDRDFSNLCSIYPNSALKIVKRIARTLSLRLRRMSAQYVDFIDDHLE
ncbi:MAG: cyclic nucleotide-binding domain-containing protein [bacterium]